MRLLSPRSVLAVLASFSAAGCAATGAAPSTGLYGDYLVGRYADMQRDPATATSRYMDALRRAPSNPMFVDGAVESALSAGDVARAEAASTLAARSGSESDLGRMTLAVAAMRRGDYAGADKQLTKVQGGAFDRLASRLIEGWALAGDNRAEAGAALMAQAGGGALFKPMFDYQRAMILDYSGNDAEALPAYETAERGGVRMAPGLIRHGRLLERTGRSDEALALYRGFVARGTEPTVAAELARLESGAADSSGPITPPQGAAVALFSLASAMVGQSDPDFYLPYLTLTQMLDPSLDAAWLVYAESLRQARKYQGARTALEKIPPSSPWYESARVRVIWSWREENKDEGALVAARDFAGQSDSRLARTTLADMERASGNFETAEALYSKLIGELKTPSRTDWPLYFARGASRERLGQFGEAEVDLRQALALSPDEPDVLNYLGYSWIERGEHLQEGLEMLQRAVSLSPKSGYIIDSLGWAHFKLGDYATALDTLERAIVLTPEDPTLNDHLGDLYWRLDRKVEARFQWRRALSLDPDAKEKPGIEQKLAQGLPPLAASEAALPRSAQ